MRTSQEGWQRPRFAERGRATLTPFLTCSSYKSPMRLCPDSCRGGTPWPPQVEVAKGGHRVPPLQDNPAKEAREFLS